MNSPAVQLTENDRVLTVFAMLGAHLGSFGILYFWLTGAILLFTGNGGQLLEIAQLSGTERLLYLGYPVLVLLSLLGWVFYALRRDLLAIGLAGLPIAGAVLYFFWLNTAR
ncbi:MAG TPA: hypothetical protein VK092_02700 [Deinococcales bacterium]|nr:hypothetical protein [Deinococcales bacterium]